LKKAFLFLLLVCACALGRAQTNVAAVDVGDLLNAAQQFARENLDDDVLRALQDVDRTQVEDFLKHYQTYLNGDYVLDLAQLKDAATAVMPLLEAHEESHPYAAWLRSRLDYFEAAEKFKAIGPVLPTNTPPKNPSFKAEQELWVEKVAPTPWPKAAVEFVPHLKPIFAAEGIPEALVWIAEVESGFDARARSPVGALGMFQLMPATAKQYGLSLWPFDERKQLEPSARAAAQHLRRLYGMFGDWRLTVAAYNCGEGRVRKELAKHKIKSYPRIASQLPAETQMYVPKVEAVVLKRDGAKLEKLPPPLQLAK
jgi:membrane-bound lytic murein transglycosylase D